METYYYKGKEKTTGNIKLLLQSVLWMYREVLDGIIRIICVTCKVPSFSVSLCAAYG